MPLTNYSPAIASIVPNSGPANTRSSSFDKVAKAKEASDAKAATEAASTLKEKAANDLKKNKSNSMKTSKNNNGLSEKQQPIVCDCQQEEISSLNENIEAADFEYKGYYKFGRILGRGSFGTVIECVRKSDDMPVVLKFFKSQAVHKWVPESLIQDHIDPLLATSSEFFRAGLGNSIFRFFIYKCWRKIIAS